MKIISEPKVGNTPLDWRTNSMTKSKSGKRKKCKECGKSLIIIAERVLFPDLCQDCYEREMGLDEDYELLD